MRIRTKTFVTQVLPLVNFFRIGRLCAKIRQKKRKERRNGERVCVGRRRRKRLLVLLVLLSFYNLRTTSLVW